MTRTRRVLTALAAAGVVALPAVPATADGAHAARHHHRHRSFCSTHRCIPSFYNGHGYIVQCRDGMWSHSGGRPGACSYHGGVKRVAAASVCSPPRGPGDSLVHSHGLRAHRLSCRKARGVALACTKYTYGSSGHCSAVGREWDCSSRKEGPLGSAQRCVSGRRSMSIHWDD